MEERDNADRPLRPDIDATRFVTDKLQLATERRVATLITTCANWTSASVVATVWSSDVSDPMSEIENLRYQVVSQTGAVPNVAIMSENVWRYLKHHPDFLDRIKYTQRGMVTVELFSSLIEVPKVLIGNSLYNSAQEGKADSMSFIWGNCFWMGYVPPAPALMEPAAGYTLRWGTNEVRRFREDQEKQDIIEVQHYFDEVICASDAGGGYYGVV